VSVKIMARRIVDLCMAVVLLLLMAWTLIGEFSHEVLGCAMFALMLVHLVLNWSWYRNLRKGAWRAWRIMQTALDFLVLACMLVSMASGIFLSRYVFAPLEISGNASLARLMHLLASYWVFCLMSVHLGMHWSVIIGLIQDRRISFVMNAIGICVAAYGLIAFSARGIWQYLFLITQFAFFNYEQPLFLFFADYVAIMGFGGFAGALLSKIALRMPARTPGISRIILGAFPKNQARTTDKE